MSLKFKNSIWDKIIKYGLENVLGLYYSEYRAIVIDNNDPLKLNRLKLIIPILNPNIPDDDWAWPVGIYSGNNYGIQVQPRKGDHVYVSFQNGNPDYPRWRHGWYGEGEKPKEFESLLKYGFKSPRGNKVIIDDSNDSENILIQITGDRSWFKIDLEKIENEAKLIKLGKNGDEQAILGNTLLAKLDNILNKLNETYNTLIIHTHPGNNLPPNINFINQLKDQQGYINDIKDKLEESLSKKVKLDK
ncbi:MAG: hypothetical protein CL596_04885 [Alteromonas sp.]|nr:hypothetical protein [Alteromonas sp.]|tara:strand:+ start:18450 stop:19187 length:738 start_codon:yes stop_codon:yes gene_type:complete